MLNDAQTERVAELLGELGDSEWADELAHYVRRAQDPDPALGDADAFDAVNKEGSQRRGWAWLAWQTAVRDVFVRFGLGRAEHRAIIASIALVAADRHIALLEKKKEPVS